MQANHYEDMNLDQVLNAAIHNTTGEFSKDLSIAIHRRMKSASKREILAYKGTPMALLNSHVKNMMS